MAKPPVAYNLISSAFVETIFLYGIPTPIICPWHMLTGSGDGSEQHHVLKLTGLTLQRRVRELAVPPPVG